jgi:hypothetical protein
MWPPFMTKPRIDLCRDREVSNGKPGTYELFQEHSVALGTVRNTYCVPTQDGLAKSLGKLLKGPGIFIADLGVFIEIETGRKKRNSDGQKNRQRYRRFCALQRSLKI